MTADPTPLEFPGPPPGGAALRPMPFPPVLNVSRRAPPWVVRRRAVQTTLVLLTAATTFAAGVVGWEPRILGVDADLALAIPEHGARGLLYMVAVLAVLGAHEAGHFIAALVHGVPATLPFFLPVPVLLTGTLGAVIGMEGSRATRRELFDIAIAGPLAGLAVALPLLWAGMRTAEAGGECLFALPLVGQWMLAAARPELAGGGAAAAMAPNALFMAGWVGLLVTGLNMMPMSQLDGGHLIYALFGDRSRWLARAVLLSSMTAIIVTGKTNWTLMIVLVTMLGVDHPPVHDEGPPLGAGRMTLGLVSLVIPLVTFMPMPLLVD